MVIEADEEIKIRQENDNLLFANSMFYDERTETGVMKNAQVFGGAPRDNSVLFANQLEKSKHIYRVKDATYCPCIFFRDNNVLENRRTPFCQIQEYDEILLSPKQKNPIRNTQEEVHNDMQKKTFLSINTDEITYDDNEKLATFKGLTIRTFGGIPFFYFPKYSFHTDGRGDSGFLMPTFVMNGTKQFGIEIPFYWKIRPDMDLVISRIQYIPLSNSYKKKKAENVNTNGNSLALDDLYKIRQSMTGFRFRHLISTKYNYTSFYNIDFLLADMSQLVDNESGYGKVKDNGDAKKGFRWMVDVQSKMQLTKTTFLKLDQIYTSDKNFLYIQKKDPRQFHTNKFHLYDVNENRYFSAELYRYQQMILNLDYTTLPVVFPVLRGEYQFKKDKLGGNLYTKLQSYYLHRDEGYSHGTLALDIGYKLPYTFKKGTKLTLETMIRNQYDNVKYNNVNGNSYSIFQNLDNALYFYYGNYSNLTQNNYYSSLGGNTNKYTFVNFNKLQAEHPFVLLSAIGKTIISPKIAIRYSPNNGRNIHIPNDDAFGMYMNYYNAFDIVQTGGLGVYDTGGSVVYGLDLTHRFNKQWQFNTGIAHNYRFTGSVSEDKLAEYTGYRRSMSDIMGHFNIKIPYTSIYGYVNYDTEHQNIRMFVGNLYFSLYSWIFLSFGYSYFSQYASFIGQKIDFINGSIILQPFKKLRVQFTAGYNPSGMQTTAGYKKPDITNYSLDVYYTISCFRLGFGISHNYFSLPNVPTMTTYSFKFALTGIG